VGLGCGMAVAVLVANTSAWVDGCPSRPSGLLPSAVATWYSVDVCGWLVWGMWVVRMVASVVVRSWPPDVWGRPSARSSLTGPFLGGISWLFCQAREHDGRQCWDLLAQGW
jgi:hypothetical protein